VAIVVSIVVIAVVIAGGHDGVRGAPVGGVNH
jgi:hypothetical protein